MNQKNIRRQTGFTLVEVIAVLVIIGILAAYAIPKFLSMQEQTERKTLEMAMNDMKSRSVIVYAKSMINNDGIAVPADFDTFAEIGFADTAEVDATFKDYVGTWGAVTATTIKYTMNNASAGNEVATFTLTPGDADNPSTIALSYGAI